MKIEHQIAAPWNSELAKMTAELDALSAEELRTHGILHQISVRREAIKATATLVVNSVALAANLPGVADRSVSYQLSGDGMTLVGDVPDSPTPKESA